MGIGFLPWLLFWITADLPGVSPWLSVGLPLLIAVLIVGYRETYNTSTWLERGGLGFFAAAGLLTLLGNAWFARWALTVSSLVMGALWLATLTHARTPLSADYSKWKYVHALWSNSTFLFINAAISLAWGWAFTASGLAGAAAVLWPRHAGWLTTLHYVLLIPAFIVTLIFQKQPDQRRIEHVERAMVRLRRWAWMGLAVTGGTLVVLIIAF